MLFAPRQEVEQLEIPQHALTMISKRKKKKETAMFLRTVMIYTEVYTGFINTNFKLAILPYIHTVCGDLD